MDLQALREDFSRRLIDFAWDQWSQMGVLAEPRGSESRTAADPEALMLLTFEVGRESPRLFDEVLDWIALNHRLVSTQRLRNLSVDEDDRALSSAVVDWLRFQRRKVRQPLNTDPGAFDDPKPLFIGSKVPVVTPEPAFLAHGFLKSLHEPLGRSRAPDLTLPVNFAFRLRSLLGLGARSEVVRTLLGEDAPRMTLQTIAASSGYAKRNVQEAAASLRAAGTLDSITVGNELRFGIDRDRWMSFLDLDRAPLHSDWPQQFHAFRVLLRWLRDPSNLHLSDYMRASNAREALSSVLPDLRFAGLGVNADGPSGDAYWPHFVEIVRGLQPN